MNIFELQKKKRKTLCNMVMSYNLMFPFHFTTKAELVAILCYYYVRNGNILCNHGIVEILPAGFAFLRSLNKSYLPSPDDVYVPAHQVNKFQLRSGDYIIGNVRLPTRTCRYFSLICVTLVNNQCAILGKQRVNFNDLIPVHTHIMFKLELEDVVKHCYTARIIDLIAPIGFGQRVLIVSPPKTGKTLMLQNLAFSISLNYEKVNLLVLLVDERPEEVTEMRKVVVGIVIASTFDESALRHIHVAQLTLEHGKRIVEGKGDVVILLDSITRLARAYNNTIPVSGRTLTGGIDSSCLQKPKRFFGAARAVKIGGSLTIIATALVDTGSKMDDIIFEEFKGTGNSEIFLSRSISEKKIYPAIDVLRSGTRRDDLLLDQKTLCKVVFLRNLLQPMGESAAIEFLLIRLKKFKNNVSFCESLS